MKNNNIRVKFTFKTQNIGYQYSTYQRLRRVENPAAWRGKLTAKPSGKFWIPIPIAKFLQKEKSYKLVQSASKYTMNNKHFFDIALTNSFKNYLCVV